MDFSRQTAFDRPVDMYVINNTNEEFTLFRTDLYSGVLTAQPTKSVKSGEKGYFKGDQTGLVGSSGLITYKSKLGNLTTYVSLYWTHPEGATRSFYCGFSSPFGLYFVTPKNDLDPSQKSSNEMHKAKDWITNEESQQNVLTLQPTGHTQSVTYIVQYSLG